MFKFNLEEKVYYVYIKYYKNKRTCGFCGGKKEIIGKNKQKHHCPICYGTGKIEQTYRKVYKVSPTKIVARYYKDNIIDRLLHPFSNERYEKSITYRVEKNPYVDTNENKIFKTRKEAQEYADKLNKEIINEKV